MKLSVFSAVAALAACAFVPHAQAVSFDCANATSAQEKQICQSPLLGQLDDELAQEWKTARAALTSNTQSQPFEQALNLFQRSWLTTRNQCQDEDCLRQRYQQLLNRLRYLNQVAQHALPTPITPIKTTGCFHGAFSYEDYLQDLTKEEYDNLGSYFQEMYDQKAPYNAVGLDMTQEKGKISGNISVAFRYANRLDDGEFTARQMSDTQAIGRRESSFGGTTKILFTCVSDDEIRISTFDTQGESYLFNMVMTRQKL
ncbi:lysozyme inhibitor LprI family protein [Symbiopectobacterium purcellii]|uniref:Lysozyme inhibitor LprI N-terminal domain-containing protein n=1 Tax=Symbiopectobacterium purcellii TaxID=2871826 RepID=A0ABX9AS74_9ENTR|nr:hypothetical protein [Symbiopectobacterium purcellii]QZN95825.1 hypothetical protein K6K13_22320 [Symbiopectobacterium purcellii]